MLNELNLRIIFLGTGTSQGVPVIGCSCEVCRSDDPKDKRLRTSALVQTKGKTFVIDVGPDFRQQLLREKIADVTAILMTHEHNDHIIGMDDVRPLNFLHKKPMPVYAEKSVQRALKTRFAYIFEDRPYPGAPRLFLQIIDYQSTMNIQGVEVIPIRIWHGKLPVLGFRFGDFTYLTDMNQIEEKELDKVRGTKILALDALHHHPHHAHLNLEGALALIERIRPEQTYLIHCSHRMGRYEEVSKMLPERVALAYDGLTLNISEF